MLKSTINADYMRIRKQYGLKKALKILISHYMAVEVRYEVEGGFWRPEETADKTRKLMWGEVNRGPPGEKTDAPRRKRKTKRKRWGGASSSEGEGEGEAEAGVEDEPEPSPRSRREK